MLSCSEKEIVFSSYAGNIYEVQNTAVKRGIFRKCRILHMPEEQPYWLYIVDYYRTLSSGRTSENWMRKNTEACFGGHVGDESFLWPVDYIFVPEDHEKAGSLGLIFSQKQMGDLIEFDEILDNRIKIIRELFCAVQNLHESGFYLNGMEPGQLFYSPGEKKVKIQVLHNCICRYDNTSETEKTEKMTDDAKYLYQEKAYSLPMGSCWKYLQLDTYARCNDVYSLATILFRDLTGRHPLNGRLCDDQEDEEGRKIIYNQNPCFIFDRQDRRNEIGQFEEEKGVVLCWQQMSQTLRELFWQLYQFPDMDESEVEKKAETLNCFCLERWIDALTELCSD